MKKVLFFLFAVCVMHISLVAQPKYNYGQLQREDLGRGVVAIRQDAQHVVVSWRYLSSDPVNVGFNIYREGVKINGTPVEKSTFFIDEIAYNGAISYEVRAVVDNKETHAKDGVYLLPKEAPTGYINIPLDKPADGKTPSGDTYTYSPNDASIGDVDGDGEYEIFLKWDPSNAHDNAHDGYTGNVLFDCYRLNGEKLWRIDLGRNVRAGAHYTQFLVYDFDGDGKAEIIMKTSDGTVDGLGKIIGDATADYREMGDTAALNRQQRENGGQPQQGFGGTPPANRQDSARLRAGGDMQRPPEGFNPNDTANRRRFEQMRRQGGNRMGFGRARTPQHQGRILTGNEYLTVFNGLTGEAMCTIDYVPQRGNLMDWGDAEANRSDRYLACVAYLDGIHPSAVMCRGYYTRATLAAFNWDGKELKLHWFFDSNNEGCEAYAGQGNHNLRVGDVDGDGCDEIMYGSCAIDHDGKGLYSTRMGHGDAMHLTGFFPDSDKLQVWDCHENKRDGSSFRDAATGKVLFQIPSNSDVGRCMAADIDPRYSGVEMWSSESGGIRNNKGELVATNVQGLSTNMAVWWDGDLSRELLDRNAVSKFNPENNTCERIAVFEGCSANNGSKSNPAIQADLLGDWREEVLLRTNDNTALRLYVTTIPTDYRFHTFLEDVPYRMSVVSENVCYNQPTQVGFYFGTDLPKGLFRGFLIK